MASDLSVHIRLHVNLPDQRPLPPRYLPVPIVGGMGGPALNEPGLRTVLVEGIFDVITTQDDPTVALIRAASRSRSHIFLSRSQCPPFAGTQATFQARWVKGRPVFVREVVEEQGSMCTGRLAGFGYPTFRCGAAFHEPFSFDEKSD